MGGSCAELQLPGTSKKVEFHLFVTHPWICPSSLLGSLTGAGEEAPGLQRQPTHPSGCEMSRGSEQETQSSGLPRAGGSRVS